ncbi:MAG TPA: hydrogenase-4 component G [Campylobacterales bacterium]|nr:hydrogenase-4 component G [Campylobacterales bacterium]
MISSMSMSHQSINQYQSASCPCESNATKNSSTEEYKAVSIQQLTIEINIQSQGRASDNFSVQTALDNISNNTKDIEDFFNSLVEDGHINMQELGYTGKPIDQLNPLEATELLGDGGFFSVENTAARASGFVMSFAGNNVELLREGRAGIIQGFEEAEKLWGGKLPDIAYESHNLALKQIDEKINSLGGTTLDILT